MSDEAAVNSRGYWDGRFATDWLAHNGAAQSRFFARQAVRCLPSWLLTQIREDAMSLVDWGCALGDGTDVWSPLVAPGGLTGVDFSPVAVAQASESYPHIAFSCANWLDAKAGSGFAGDIVFSSNTLEHFECPIEVLEVISRRAAKAVILALPYREHDRIAEHAVTFLPGNIPLTLESGFRLHWSCVLDCRTLPGTQWYGEQVFLVYVRPDWLSSLMVPPPLHLAHLMIEAEASPGRLLRERDEQIVRLSAALAASERQLAHISAHAEWLGARPGLIDRLPGTVRRPLSLLMSIARTFRSHGLLAVMAKVARRLFPAPAADVVAAPGENEKYLLWQSAESHRVGQAVAGGMSASDAAFVRDSLLADIVHWDKVVLYPLSYPLALTQRPDHVLRCFVARGYRCLMVTFDDSPPFIREVGSNIHLTNRFEAVVELLAARDVVFYLTAPRFRYLLDYLQRPVIVYDVLDELILFAHHGEALKADHQALLERADLTLFSSRLLLEQNQDALVGPSALVTNGVWAGDFVVAPEQQADVCDYRQHPGEFVLGYHGVITELLDWPLLARLAAIPRLRLVLIGPVAQFAEVVDASLLAQRASVLAMPQVTHVGLVPYAQLKFHLGGFDAAIVPFVVDARTDSVSPLKLFEYMAMGLPAYATPTRTLSGYADVITVADSEALPALLRQAVRDRDQVAAGPDYDAVLREVDWGRQLAPVITRLDERLAGISAARAAMRRVDIINFNFYDWDGETLYKGGAERYIHDLACLLRDCGWAPRILQGAHRPFESDHHGIPVIGVPADPGRCPREMSAQYREICRDADLVIASPAELACALQGLNVIGINHGIYWDETDRHLVSSRSGEPPGVFDALKVAATVVAVDTNFANWVRTCDYALSSKIAYLPNYYDGDVFSPGIKDFSGRLRFLYARRLHPARGLYLMIDAFDHLLAHHDNIDLHIVGQAGEPEHAGAAAEFVARHPGRVRWQELDMQDMHMAYRDSHIALVPTRCSEGTSLSCLEAMATRHAVIATQVGGLPNLVVDGFNGLLIEPTVEALTRAVEQLLADRSLLARMADQGVALAACFEKAHWSRRWRELLMRSMR